MEILIKLALSYLIGSTSGSILLGKLKGVDIRKMGSGNAGGTNAFRTQGATFAVGVLFIDIMKGFISAKFISAMNLPIFSSSAVDPNILIIFCGVAAVLGHVYPVYHGFRGGKGGGAAIGMVFAISWPSITLAILLWLVILLLTGYVGLGTMLGSVSVIYFAHYFRDTINNPYFIPFTIFLCFFIIYTHRSNIKRMLDGTENRFEKAMIFRKKS
ncbi:MAG: glycerol-3-phosphate 1-O-acyltransferase PlsY [Candidatus Marinimicrobia bacterium]|nr:glycerol-3-phosphate 1-O-acyltransferase PlsY [Candidatus Neomarinimicrobiota bacterium]